jgi:hypothetical protein
MPEVAILRGHRRENLKSYTFSLNLAICTALIMEFVLYSFLVVTDGQEGTKTGTIAVRFLASETQQSRPR